MNSSSTIQISKSSLLSLKAEVLRKQQEINTAKLQAQNHPQTRLRQKIKGEDPLEQNDPHNKGVEERQLRDRSEDEDLLQKSRKMLEAKAKLYNRLVKGPSQLTEDEIELNSRCLVQFDRKTRASNEAESSEEEHFSDEYEPAENPDEEWVEYVDCLGRTRKCLRKDLEYLKEKDNELSKTLDPERRKQATNTDESTKPNRKSFSELLSQSNELLSSDMRREILRQEWEKQEEELTHKKDIHYQDVLFNEARSHGVGYYTFSQDEEERAKQQKELKKLREETKEQQKASLEQRALREQQLAARLKAAKNRKRARMGLPPEEDEPEVATPSVNEESSETIEDKEKNVAKENLDKAKQKARSKHIRPWDIGKEGVKEHYEYSQEEWVEKKRKERPKEFAPPVETKRKQSVVVEETTEDSNTSLFFTTKNKKKLEVDNFNKKKSKEYFWMDTSVPPPNFKPTTESINPYKSNTEACLSSFTPTPILNECIDFDEEQEYLSKESDDEEVRGKGAEIAPPATFEYYGPSGTTKKESKPNQSLEDSIAAGLKYLREQAEKKENSRRRRDFE